MREIKFRGKRVDNGEWVKGSLVINTIEDNGKITKQCHIQDVAYGVFPNDFMSGFDEVVDPTTVGQYTGLKDKNGVEIYEGDVVHYWGGEYCQGYWEYKGSVIVDFTDYGGLAMMGEIGFLEVVSNIYENPELLGVTP